MSSKILTIFGTRPEAIKLAPVIKELEKYPKKFTPLVCVTAQHRQMLDQVLKVFGIKPDYDLNIMQHNQSLHDITATSLLKLKAVIEKAQPDCILIQGDTTTTFIASLAAFYVKIPVAHVEAGLRTNDKYQPFPEEINRRLTTHIADLHFAPTERAKQNLLREGIDAKKIYVTGNTVIDALFLMLEKIKNKKLAPRIEKDLVAKHPSLSRVFRRTSNSEQRTHKKNPKIVLVTGHRRENFGQGFKNICQALKEIARSHNDVEIIYPVHLNPNVQAPVKKILDGVNNIHLIEPLDYGPFVYLMDQSCLIITDSGGVQEEAPSLGKPVLVMRETTERPEAVRAGTARIVGTSTVKIISQTKSLLTNARKYQAMSRAYNPYGDGNAAARIVDVFLSKKT